jgi:hypothetical protein
MDDTEGVVWSLSFKELSCGKSTMAEMTDYLPAPFLPSFAHCSRTPKFLARHMTAWIEIALHGLCN